MASNLILLGTLILLLCAAAPGCRKEQGKAAAGALTGPAPGSLVELSIAEVVFQRDGTPGILLLRPDRRIVLLPVNLCESEVIYARLHAVPFPRPMTHDLFQRLADGLDLEVPWVVVDRTAEDSLTASISLKGAGRSAEVLASAGDALAIAQRMSARILGTPRLLSRHTLEADGPGGMLPRPSPQAPGAPAQPAPRKKTIQFLLSADEPVEMRVLAVVQVLAADFMILLTDEEERSVFPMVIDRCQALVISAHLKGREVSSIHTHHLLHRLLEVGGAQMTHAGVVSIQGQTFIGEVGLALGKRRLAIDARPSDAIALALLLGVPIRIARSLVEEYGEDPESYRDGVESQPRERL